MLMTYSPARETCPDQIIAKARLRAELCFLWPRSIDPARSPVLKGCGLPGRKTRSNPAPRRDQAMLPNRLRPATLPANYMWVVQANQVFALYFSASQCLAERLHPKSR